MNTDIRVSVDFWDHHKTQKLIKRLGLLGAISLQRLWMYAAKYRPDGDLYGMDQDDILFAAQFKGRSTKFVGELLELQWLDFIEGSYRLHDWHDHNPWACGAKDRSNVARFCRMAKTHPEIYEELRASGRSEVTREEYDKLIAKQRDVNEPLTIGQRDVNERLTNDLSPAPAPAPAPAPTPLVKEETKELCATDVARQADYEVFLTKKKRRLMGKGLETFLQFWEAFSYKKDKAKAADAWLSIPCLNNGLLTKILAAAQLEAKLRPKLIADGLTPIYAEGWLSGRRWEDEHSETGKSESWAERREREREAERTGTHDSVHSE